MPIKFSLFICSLSLGIFAPYIQASEATPSTLAENITLIDVVQLTLKHSPNIEVKRLGVDKFKAKQEIAGGKFDVDLYATASFDNNINTTRIYDQLDPAQQATFSRPPVNNELKTDTDQQKLTMGASKKFRTGVSADINLSMKRSDPRQDAHRFTTNRSHVEFTINIPFLKGAGRASAMAEETVARLNHQAGISNFQHALTATLLEAIKAYWDYKQSVVYLEKVKESAHYIQIWLDSTEIASDSLQGYLEEVKGRVIDAEQKVEENKINLINTMGIEISQDQIGKPHTNVRLEWDDILANFDQETMRKQWIAQAEKNRLDLKAVLLQVEASHVLLGKAKTDLLPSLNLKLSTGYNGYKQNNGFDNFSDSLLDNVRGMESSAMLSLKYPLGNHVAKGKRDLQQASYSQSLIESKNKLRTVHLDVKKEVVNVYGRLKKAVQMRKTTQSYKKSIIAMQENPNFFKETVKLLSLIDMEDKFISSLEDSSIAMTDLMKAIAQARFQTGTLADVDATAHKINLETLMTLPNM